MRQTHFSFILEQVVKPYPVSQFFWSITSMGILPLRIGPLYSQTKNFTALIMACMARASCLVFTILQPLAALINRGYMILITSQEARAMKDKE